jgi:hypothetical protein
MAAALTVVLFTGASVKASSVGWAYTADSFSVNANQLAAPVDTSTIFFNGVQIGHGSSVLGDPNGSGAVIYNLTTTSNAPSPGDNFSSVPIALSVTLTDINATKAVSGTVKASDTFQLSGKLSVNGLTTDGNISQATITWDQPSVSKVLGTDGAWYNYTATPGNFVIPQPNNPNSPGSFQIFVSVTPADGPPGSGTTQPSATPEPASLVLASLGLPLIVLARRRRNKA